MDDHAVAPDEGAPGSVTPSESPAGIDDTDGGSFVLRHTFAIRQLRRGTPPHDVSRWLGLSDPQPMRRYLRVIAGPEEVV